MPLRLGIPDWNRQTDEVWPSEGAYAVHGLRRKPNIERARIRTEGCASRRSATCRLATAQVDILLGTVVDIPE